MDSFLAGIQIGSLSGILLPLTVVTLAMIIPIVAIIVDHFQKKNKLRVIEKAIEHGVDISSLKLGDECDSGPRLPYRAGMITLAVGVALVVVSRLVLPTFGGSFGASGVFQVLTVIGGAICICVGVAMLINDWMNRDRFRQDETADGTSGPYDLRG
jgi:hypothetical protein